MCASLKIGQIETQETLVMTVVCDSNLKDASAGYTSEIIKSQRFTFIAANSVGDNICMKWMGLSLCVLKSIKFATRMTASTVPVDRGIAVQ